jgi:hypothetical protein
MAVFEPVYNIWIRGIKRNTSAQPIGLERIMLVTDYVKLEFKLRYNDVGGWSLLMRDGTDQANKLRQLLVGSSTDPVGTTSSGQGFGGIVVTRNGTIVFSGPLRGFVATGDENDGPMVEFHGCDDTGYLASRLAMVPSPTQIPPASGQFPFVAPAIQGWGYWVFPAGVTIRKTTDVLFNLVSLNIGPSAPYNIPGGQYQNRRIPFLEIDFPSGDGPSVKVRTRYQSLLEKCQEVATYVPFNPQNPDFDATYRGLQFSITQTPNDTLKFNYGRPVDKRTSVVLTTGDPNIHSSGNIGTYRYSLDAPTVNFSVIAGQGESTQRFFEHRGAQYANSIVGQSIQTYGLWEGFLDRRDIQYTNPVPNPTPPPIGNADYQQMIGEFIRSMDVQLREEGEITTCEVTVIDGGNTQFFRDYNIGDVVTARIQGQDIVGQVMDVTVTLTKDDGEKIEPTIGTQVIGSTTRLFNEIYKQQKNIGHLDTSQ